jgi:hypothetical protein
MDFQKLLLSKMLEMTPSGVKKIFAYLCDLAFDKVDGHLRVDPSWPHLHIPSLVKVQNLSLAFSLLKQVPAE